MWFKIDDKWWSHRKTRSLLRSNPDQRRDPAAVGLWALAGGWCADVGSDGFIPEDELAQWADNWDDLAQRLVLAGYWHHDVRDDEKGYRFHDWDGYQPSAYEREQLRLKRAEAGRKGGQMSGLTRKARASSKTEANASSKSEPRPDPTRRSMAGPVSQLQVVGANGEELTIDPAHMETIANLTGGDTTWATSVANVILARTHGTVRSAGPYVIAAITDDPAAYRYQRGHPTKTQQCPTHPGEWADHCRACAIDRRVGDA